MPHSPCFRRTRPALALTLSALALPAGAQLLAADSFLVPADGAVADPAAGEYSIAPSPLLGASPDVAGFTGQWTGQTSPNGLTLPSSNFTPTTGSLGSLNLDYPTGGKINFGSVQDGRIRYLSRPLDPSLRDTANTPISTYFMSGLVNPGSVSAEKFGFGLMGFTNNLNDGRLTNDDNSGNFFGAMWGFNGKGEDGFDLVVRSRLNTGTSGAPVFEAADTVILADAPANVTYNVVLQIDVNVDGGAADTITWWIDPDSPTAAPGGSFESFSMNSPSEDNFDFASLAVQDFTNTVFFDEFRVGLSFADVAGPFAAAGGLIGDFSGDGFVGQDDLNLILLNFGATELPDGFDVTGLDPETSPDGFDGIIGQNELNDVLLNFGNSSDPAANTIPEPTSLALLGIGGLAIGRRRRA